MIDIDDTKLGQLEDIPHMTTLRMDVSDTERLSEAMKRFDLISGALPSSLGFKSVSAAIEARVSIVDMSFMPENPLVLHSSAEAARVTVVPDCGVAPGLSNILVGRAFAQLDAVEEVHIVVGGLPRSPQPPLGYAVTWSVRDLVEEYVRPARIVKNGLQTSIDPLSELSHVDVPGLGRLEAFYTDGLRTLLHTVTGVKEMDERTLRHPGHVERVKVLRDCGFFSDERVVIDGCRVSPRDFSASILSRSLVQKDARDVTVLQVKVSGEKRKQRTTIQWRLLDHYDEVKGVSSMARTTAYTNVAVCTLLLQGLLKDRGVIPPEDLGMNNAHFLTIMTELEKRGVKAEGCINGLKV